jgi:hypothetical protein
MKRNLWWSSWLCACVAALAFVTGVRALEAPDPDISVTPIARDGQVLVSFDGRLEDARPAEDLDAVRGGSSGRGATPFSGTRSSRLFSRPSRCWPLGT